MKQSKDCVVACKATKACQYMNYDVREHKCALIRTDVITENIGGLVVSKPGYIFGNKSEWNLDAFADCKQCNRHGKCHVDGTTDNEVSTCRNSGCRIPDTKDFKGNMFMPGSRILLKCDLPIPKHVNPMTCMDNGTWLQHAVDCAPSFQKSYYYKHNAKMTWHEAKEHCESLAGHLVDVGSHQEQSFIESLVDTSIWLGGNDLENEGHFVWSTGAEVNQGYTKWENRQPDNFLSSEHCMEMRGLGFWNDVSCHTSIQSICEFEVN